MSDRVAVFAEGKLCQIAPPKEIYNRPTSRFVGEFVGDSNFFEARVSSSNPVMLEIAIAGSARMVNANLPAGTMVDLLVRPERVRIAGPGDDLTTVQLTVDTIVDYGDSVLAIGRVGDRPMRMRIAGNPPSSLREGATLTVGWSPEEAHAIPRS